MIYRVMDITPLLEKTTCKTYFDKLSDMRKAKAMTYQRHESRARSIGAGYLLETILREKFGFTQEQIENLRYMQEEHGKPILPDYPDIHFSISHSGHYVACAVSDRLIGIDIQEKKGYRENIAKRFFSKEEQDCIEQAETIEQRENLFFHIWTGKESYSKLLGVGLLKALSDYTIDTDNCKVIDKENRAEYVLSYPWENKEYLCCICEIKDHTA